MATQAQTRFDDYVIRDIGLADYGRKEIGMAEIEMPGLMSIRKKYATQKPLKGKMVVVTHGPELRALLPRLRRST